jgi:PPM family protein phosphatase
VDPSFRAGEKPSQLSSSSSSSSSSPSLLLEATGRSEQGHARDINQDAFAVCPSLGLFVIADGMGGHPDGEIASAVAVDAVQRFYADPARTWPTDADGPVGDPRAFLVAAVKHAHARIRARAAPIDPFKRSMGTTIAAVHAASSGFCVAHVGDSRVYRLRGRALELLTRDHTRLNEYLGMGASRAAAMRMPDHAFLSRALGTRERIEVDVRMEDARPGDVVLLCTDGLSNIVTDEQIARVLAGESDVEATAAALIAAAEALGAQDDVTCVVLRY